MVSRLLKTSKMSITRPDSTVFPLLSKLSNVKNPNPFAKKDIASTSAATTAAPTDAAADDPKQEDAQKTGEEKTVDSTEVAAEATKVSRNGTSFLALPPFSHPQQIFGAKSPLCAHIVSGDMSILKLCFTITYKIILFYAFRYFITRSNLFDNVTCRQW